MSTVDRSLISFHQSTIRRVPVLVGIVAFKFILISLTKKERQGVINNDIFEQGRCKLCDIYFSCKLEDKQSKIAWIMFYDHIYMET